MTKITYPLLILIGCFLLLSQTGHSQEATAVAKRIYIDSSKVEKLPVSFSYYGIILTHPGGRLSVEYPLRRKVKERPPWKLMRVIGLAKEDKKILRYKTTFVNVGTAVYYHRHNHTGWLLSAEIGQRKTFGNSGLFYEVSYGLGHLRSFLPTTYEVTDDNEVKRVRFAGNSYFAPTLAIGAGFDFEPKYNIPAKVWYRTNGMILYPYNHLFSGNLAFEFGMTFSMLNNPIKK